MRIRHVTRMEILESLIILHNLFDQSDNCVYPPFKGLEIGCLRADVDRYLLLKFHNLIMTSVEREPKHEEIKSSTHEFGDRFNLVECNSNDFEPETYDFVFIDGDHSYEQTKKDIEHFLPAVKPGGFISGHNYDKFIDGTHPGVRKAVDEIFGNKVNIINADVTWWVSV